MDIVNIARGILNATRNEFGVGDPEVEKKAEERRKLLMPYQINSHILSKAAPGVKIMHCLPAEREWEITSEVLDGPQSIVLDQAENRLHAQKAILLMLDRWFRS